MRDRLEYITQPSICMLLKDKKNNVYNCRFSEQLLRYFVRTGGVITVFLLGIIVFSRCGLWLHNSHPHAAGIENSHMVRLQRFAVQFDLPC